MNDDRQPLTAAQLHYTKSQVTAKKKVSSSKPGCACLVRNRSIKHVSYDSCAPHRPLTYFFRPTCADRMRRRRLGGEGNQFQFHAYKEMMSEGRDFHWEDAALGQRGGGDGRKGRRRTTGASRESCGWERRMTVALKWEREEKLIEIFTGGGERSEFSNDETLRVLIL